MRRLRHDYTSTVKTNLFSKTPHLHRKLISRNNFEEISSTYDDKTSILLSYKGILWTKNVYAKILDVSVHTDLLQPALSSRPGLRFGRAKQAQHFHRRVRRLPRWEHRDRHLERALRDLFGRRIYTTLIRRTGFRAWNILDADIRVL